MVYGKRWVVGRLWYGRPRDRGILMVYGERWMGGRLWYGRSRCQGARARSRHIDK